MAGLPVPTGGHEPGEAVVGDENKENFLVDRGKGGGEGGKYQLTLAFLAESEAEQQRELQAEEDRRQRELTQAQQRTVGAVIGLVIALALALWGWTERHRAEAQRDKAQAAEQTVTRNLFDSTLTHASLLTKIEDFAAAREKLESTRKLDPEIPAQRRHARDLLAGFISIMGEAAAEYTYQDGDKPLAALIGGVAISPDGHWLAAAGERDTLALFERDSGKLVQQLEGHNAEGSAYDTTVRDIVFHPEQPWLFSGDNDGRIIRWQLPQDGQEAKLLQQWQTDRRVNALASTSDGKVLASGHDDGKIRLWQADNGKLLRVLEGHSGLIAEMGLAFSPNGRQLASASYDNTVRLWDWEKQKSVPKVLQGAPGEFRGVAFSSDGKLLATSGDTHILLWDAETGQRVKELKGHQNTVFGLQFFPNGPLASGSKDNTIRLWDVETGVTRRILQGHTAAVGGFALWQGQGQDAVTLYSASNDGTVKRWGGALPQQWLAGLPGEPTPNAISPDGRLVAVGFNDGSLRVYALPDGEGMPALVYEMLEAHKDRLVRLAFNPDGSRLASGGMDGVAKVWSLNDGGNGAFKLTLEKTFDDHKDAVHAVTFSPDDSQLATASYDGRIGLFTLGGEGKTLFEAHEGPIVAVSFHASGKQLLSAQDFSFKLWNLEVQPPALQSTAKASDKLLWASLSPDGTALASVGREQTVSVYPTSGDAPPLRLNGHEQTVFKAIFSPDSRQLATVSGDLRLWDLDTQSELFRLRLPVELTHGPPLWDFDFRCTPTGCWIAVPLTSGKLALYNLGKIDYE